MQLIFYTAYHWRTRSRHRQQTADKMRDKTWCFITVGLLTRCNDWQLCYGKFSARFLRKWIVNLCLSTGYFLSFFKCLTSNRQQTVSARPRKLPFTSFISNSSCWFFNLSPTSSGRGENSWVLLWTATLHIAGHHTIFQSSSWEKCAVSVARTEG